MHAVRKRAAWAREFRETQFGPWTDRLSCRPASGSYRRSAYRRLIAQSIRILFLLTERGTIRCPRDDRQDDRRGDGRVFGRLGRYDGLWLICGRNCPSRIAARLIAIRWQHRPRRWRRPRGHLHNHEPGPLEVPHKPIGRYPAQAVSAIANRSAIRIVSIRMNVPPLECPHAAGGAAYFLRGRSYTCVWPRVPHYPFVGSTAGPI